jgi:DNA-binding NtrC family response regulator
VGATEAIRSIRREIETVAALLPPIVVIAGETGSGRELAARNLHARRFKGIVPPLAVLPRQTVPAADTLRLLTGQKAGASRGILEEAHGTGLAVRCADELSRRILEFLIGVQKDGRFQPGGGKPYHPLETSFYLICEDAEAALSVMAGQRVDVIQVPPLRDRKEDIPLLVAYLLEAHRQRGREGAGALDPSAMANLLAHDWPGNVAELRIVLEYGALRAMADGSKTICREHLAPAGVADGDAAARRWDLDYREARIQVELVEAAIEELATTNKTKLSGFLHVLTPTTLTRRIERALERFPELHDEFPRTADAFLKVEGVSS